MRARKTDYPIALGCVAASLLCSSCLCTQMGIVATSNFNYFVCRSMQSEAKANLKEIAELEQSYHGVHGRYGDLDEIGFSVDAEEQPRYTFELVERSSDHFVARAHGRIHQGDQELLDLWLIDDTGTLESPVTSCRKSDDEE